MPETRKISVADIMRDEAQPRKHFDEGELLALGQNMLTNGQQVPVIVYADGKYTLLDGERRWRAAQLVGIKELNALVLDKKPTAAELAILQASIDLHRVNLKMMERANLALRIQKETGKGVVELAGMLNISHPRVSTLLSFTRLAPELQAMLDAGTLDSDKAYAISQEPDHAKQLELAKDAGSLSRAQVRQKVKGNGQAPQVKIANARFPLSTALCVTVQGAGITLIGAIDALSDALKELKRGQAQGIEIDAMMKVMKDKAKAGK